MMNAKLKNVRAMHLPMLQEGSSSVIREPLLPSGSVATASDKAQQTA